MEEWSSRGEYFRVWSAVNNMRAVRKLDPREEIRLFGELIEGFRTTNRPNTQKYLQLRLGLEQPATAAALPSVPEYHRLLVEILVDRSYKGPGGLIRRDYPGAYGTGFLVDSRHVLTAFHVVEGVYQEETQEANILVKGGEKILEHAEILSSDSLSDLAVLELPEPLPMPYRIHDLLGNSDALVQGFGIHCLGHSRGYASSLTRGIVSAVKRRAPEVGSWLQMDADVSPGASGGLVIGDDSHIYGMVVTGYLGEGINFAVPSMAILGAVDRMLEGRDIRRPWLGLLLSESWREKGQVEIIDLFPTSPVRACGIEVGDRLLELDHEPVERIPQAQEMLYDLEAGTWVHLKVQKEDGRQLDRWVRLARRPDYAIYNATREGNRLSSLYPHFGFEVNPDGLRTERVYVKNRLVSLTFYEVRRVHADSFLASRGVKPGDLLGFIDDHFEDRTRYLQVLHLPKGKSLKDLEEVSDYVYSMIRRHTDANIL